MIVLSWEREELIALNLRSPWRRVTADTPVVLVPTELMVTAWRSLFPAERMCVFGGRTVRRGTRVTCSMDVTEARPTVVHVRSSPERLTTALLDLERSGAHLSLWMHSHPGSGPGATHPSDIDLRQETQWRAHYSERLISLIAVRDGYLRVWGTAIRERQVQLRWSGTGIDAVPGEADVYKITM